ARNDDLVWNRTLTSSALALLQLCTIFCSLTQPFAELVAAEAHVSQFAVAEFSQDAKIGLTLTPGNRACDPAVDHMGKRLEKKSGLAVGRARPCGRSGKVAGSTVQHRHGHVLLK